MKPDRISDERMRLFESVLSERADAETFAALERLLEQDPRAREEFAWYSRIDVDLRHAFRTGMIPDDSGAPRIVQLPHTAAGAPLTQRRTTWRRAGWIGSAVAAALLLLYFQLGTDRSGELSSITRLLTRPPGPVATLSQQNNAVWQGTQIENDQAILEGDMLTLIKGEARISVGSGAEIAVVGPCSMTFVTDDLVQLHSGEVTVQVAEWAKGFKVVTEAMEVIDLGTTFTVSATRGVEKTGVIKGQVRVSPRTGPTTGPRSLLLSEGEAIKIDRAAGGLERLPLVLEDFEAIDFGESQPYKPVALHNTGVGFQVGDEDPHWRVIARPGEPVKPQYAVVCEPDERYMPNDPLQSQWVSTVDWRESEPNSVYTFQARFDLTGFDLQSIQLFGRFLADNGISEVRVNGQSIRVESWADNEYGQEFEKPQFRTINVTGGLVQGENAIEIDVWNGTYQHLTPETPNPMSLRVEWLAFGRQDSREHAANLLEPLIRK